MNTMASDVDVAVLEQVFGTASEGASLEQRAKSSKKRFVRSLDQVAEWSAQATGRELSAYEVLSAYGMDVLRKVADEGYAPLCSSPRSAGDLVRERRGLLGLDVPYVAKAAGVDCDAVILLEAYKRVAIKKAENVAQILGLDERLLSWKSEPPPDNDRVAVRLRSVGQERPQLTPVVVAAIAEAAWVASTQLRLERDLGIRPAPTPLEKSDNYGGPGYPPFQQGYYLASHARDELKFGTGPLPIPLRELAEDRLGIPVVQTELGSSIAGVTVEFGQDRAIVLNLSGKNRDVFVRRATVAHELGHLLFDPAPRLETLRVDEYSDLERGAHEVRDPVEQRANAFGIEFLAPRAAVADYYRMAPDGEGVWAVMDHFGVSYTAARYQIRNGLDQQLPLERLVISGNRTPDVSWEGREGYTAIYHPIHAVRPSRAGRFSGVVVRAAEESVISWDTAASMLESEASEVERAASAIKDLFPPVFG